MIAIVDHRGQRSHRGGTESTERYFGMQSLECGLISPSGAMGSEGIQQQNIPVKYYGDPSPLAGQAGTSPGMTALLK